MEGGARAPAPEATVGEGRGVRISSGIPVSPGQLSAICLLPRLFAFMHFNDATLFLTQFVYFTPVSENIIGSVIYFRAAKLQMATPVYTIKPLRSVY